MYNQEYVVVSLRKVRPVLCLGHLFKFKAAQILKENTFQWYQISISIMDIQVKTE